MQRRRFKLTAVIKVECPVWSGWPRAVELWIFCIYIPANVAEDLVVFFLDERIDAGDLLDLPRLKYADKDFQDVDRPEANPHLSGGFMTLGTEEIAA